MSRTAWTLSLVGLLALSGCKTPAGRFLEDRGRDTLDMIPVSIATGEGLYFGGRATQFAGTGFGYAETTHWGWVRRRQNDSEPLETSLAGYMEWDEKVWGWGLMWERNDDPPPGQGNFAFLVPIKTEPASIYTYYPGSVFDIEADAFIGILGARIAISPSQMIDWLLGWGTLDILKDDQNKIEDAGGGKAKAAK